MKKLNTTLLIMIIVAAVSLTAGAAEWRFEVMGGSAYNFPTPLTIEQEGYDTIYIDAARYNTNPFRESPYYSWRVGKWEQKQAWEVELVHHKLYLQNDHDRIDHFEISHGYNLITLNKAKEKGGLIFRAGAGIILAHPETTVNGKSLPEEWKAFDMGFYVAGPTAQVALGKNIDIYKNLYAAVEGKLTASYAYNIPVRDGKAVVPNLAAHGLIGLGYKF